MASSKPYKATELWLEMHSAFRRDMPVGRHRRYMKSYNQCFVGSDAVSWMTDYIIKHPVFRQNIPRANTVQLLRKFHQAQIFEDVRGSKYNKEEFTDNNRLFRFCDDGETTRLPLSTINQDKLKTRPPIKPPSKPSQLVTSVSPQQIEDTWKTVTLTRLQNILRLASLADILDENLIDAKNIMHNTTHLSKNGVVVDTKNPNQLPQWVIAAMKYVAYYPQKDRDMKYYDGFEKDAFGVVRTYFEELNQSLVPDEMYELFVRVFLYTQKDIPQESAGDPDPEIPISVAGLKSCTSVENLIMDLTIAGSMEGGSEKSPVDAEITFNPGETFHYPDNRPSLHDSMNEKLSLKRFDPSQTLPLRPDSEIRKARHLSTPVMSNHFNAAQSLPVRNVEFYHDSVPNQCLSHKNPHFGKSRPLSVAPNTRIETSFSVTDCEPRTYIYPSRPASEAWYEQGSQKTSQSSHHGESVAEAPSSVWSDQSQCNADDEVGLGVSQRTVSMTDISQMVPCPENELAKQERLSTWLQNQNCYDAGQEPSYGYTVVVSTTPNPKLAQKRIHGQSSSNLASVAKVELPHEFNKFDHNYCTTVNPMTQSAWELEASPIYRPDPPCLAGRPAPPPYMPRSVSPPYVPPPSYESLYKPQNPFSLFLDEDKRAPPSSTSSTYETAATHLTPSSLARSISQPASAMSCHSSTSNLLTASVAALPKKEAQPKLTKMASESQVQSRSSGVMRQRSMSLSNNLTRSRTNLTESYRRAMAVNGTSMTPTGHSLYQASSVPDLTAEQASDRTKEALQLCTLFLPPSSRRKLHLLLRFMWRVRQNEELQLDENGGDSYILVLDVFTRCVIWSSDVTDEEKLMLRTLVEYLVSHHDTIMIPPGDLPREVELKLQQMRQVKIEYISLDNPSSLTYCQQVTVSEYESQRLSSSQRALQGLLEGILSNKRMSGREKHKKLKQFQKAHPDIYARRFPSGMIGGSMDNVAARASSSRHTAMKPLLKKPLQKLRSIRL